MIGTLGCTYQSPVSTKSRLAAELQDTAGQRPPLRLPANVRPHKALNEAIAHLRTKAQQRYFEALSSPHNPSRSELFGSYWHYIGFNRRH